jgi:peptidoglycan pentaglycine glycine transferase (the first glycine)
MMVTSWNDLIKSFYLAHVLQSQEWGELKSKFGWKVCQVIWVKQKDSYQFREYADGITVDENVVAAAQILIRSIEVGGFSARMRIFYIPKGPLLDWHNNDLRKHVLVDLHDYAKKHGAIFLKIDPDIILGTGIPQSTLASEDTTGKEVSELFHEMGFCFSKEQIQFRNTVTINLSSSEDELLANMKQKTRYNIRLAERKGIKIRVGSTADIPMLYQMYAETSIRDNFVIRSAAYYELTWSKFINAGIAVPFIAEYNKEPLAAIIVFTFAGKSRYFYGMSRDKHREKMPNYLLQWEAMKYAKITGSLVYDLWGAPDHFVETDPLWNVFRFKEGLGGQVIRHIGAWDLPVKPMLYKLYSQVLPRIMEQMRNRGKKQTHQSIAGI